MSEKKNVNIENAIATLRDTPYKVGDILLCNGWYNEWYVILVFSNGNLSYVNLSDIHKKPEIHIGIPIENIDEVDMFSYQEIKKLLPHVSVMKTGLNIYNLQNYLANNSKAIALV